jgi:hypothetical protein
LFWPSVASLYGTSFLAVHRCTWYDFAVRYAKNGFAA